MDANSEWEIIIEKAIRDDNSLLFPQKLSREFLERAKRTMGSYLFANQYLNEVIPAELQTFKKDWFNYHSEVPKNTLNFIYIDPALSEADTADFTGVVVVAVDHEKRWYVKYARRLRVTPTQLISYIFELNREFAPSCIGIEEVAFQKAILYFLDEEMRRRNITLPIKGIKPPTTKTKQMRILSMVPRFEFQRITLAPGLNDLELELLQFPRGAHDDLIDALASIEFIYYPPEKEKRWPVKPGPNHPDYERWFIEQRMITPQEEN